MVTGEEFGLNLQSLQHGYHQWHNKKANKRMVLINQDLPTPQDPIYYQDAKGKDQCDEAAEARAFKGTFEDGTAFDYETSTFGGRKAADAMLAELFQRAAESSAYLFPRVRLDSNSYDHSQYGLVYEPVLTTVGWYNEDGELEGAAPKKLPKKKKAKATAPVVEAEEAAPVEETPSSTPAEPPRRRRRAAA